MTFGVLFDLAVNRNTLNQVNYFGRIGSYLGVLPARKFVHSPSLGIPLVWRRIVGLKGELNVMMHVQLGPQSP